MAAYMTTLAFRPRRWQRPRSGGALGHVGHGPVSAVHSSGEVVDQDGPADADLVAQEPGVGEFGLEALVVADVFAGMRFSGVDENPLGLGMSFGRDVKQRTLCRAVRSSERAELHDQRLRPP